MKAKIKLYCGYRIAKNYRSMTMWEFREDTKKLVSTLKMTPGKQLSRMGKWEAICDTLRAAKIPIPPFKPFESHE